MIHNNLKIAYRNLIRNKGYSFINISGLAIGMACTILLLIWVNHELSYDKFHKDNSKLYQVVTVRHYTRTPLTLPNLPGKLIDAIKENIPQIKYASNYNSFGHRIMMNYNNTKQYKVVNFADPDFLKMFSFPLIKGNIETALNDPFSMIITQKAAKKIFGDKDPMGKIIQVDNKYDIKITGILKDLPSNTIFDFEYLLPFELYKKYDDYWKNWGSNYHYGYAMLNDNAQKEDIDKMLGCLLQKQIKLETKTTVGIFPLKKCHLYNFNGSESRMKSVKLFLMIAIFILFIACFNFMNLSTARASKRAKEIGLKKTLGATRFQLIRQFLGESILISFIAINFAIILVRILLPQFNSLLQQELHFYYTDKNFILCILAVILATGLLAGAYPAFYLTSQNTINVLKGINKSGKKGTLFRKTLVVIQFILSVLLITSTIIVSLQTHYMQNKELGLDKSNIIYVPITGELTKKIDIVKRELVSDACIEGACSSKYLPTAVYSNGRGAKWEGKDPQFNPLISFLAVDAHYPETFKLKLLNGQFFNTQNKNTNVRKLVVNEKLARMISNESVIGKSISYGGAEAQIIGVVKDFHYTPVNSKIGPLLMYINSEPVFLFIRHNGANVSRALNHIQKVITKYNPDFPLETNFLEDKYATLYRGQENTMNILKYFAILAIIISCLGLFGLASFMAEEKTKEIGIRKIMGASVASLVGIFSREFTKWVLLANLIAWPIAWFYMEKWLNNYAYRIEMPLWVFVAVAALVIIIASITVGHQSWRSATQDPVKSLKYE